MTTNSEYIKQHGKTIQSASDTVSIPMIFRNIIGLNITGQQYIQYLQDVVFTDMRLSPGRIEHWRDEKLISIGNIPGINQ